MTLPKELTTVESPKSLLLGESRAYTIDFSNLGTPQDAGISQAYAEDGSDVSAVVLSGSPVLNGAVVTMKLFTPNVAGMFRLVQKVVIGGQNAFGVVDVAVFATPPPSTAQRTPATGTYSSSQQVAALVPRYANKRGDFDDTTRPTIDTVVDMLEQISAMVNSILAREGFVTPLTNAAVKPAIDLFVAQEVAALVEGINGSGRFGPTAKAPGKRGRFAIIIEDVEAFVEANAAGFERLGAQRSFDFAGSIAYRDVDESGQSIFPLRQRKEFGALWEDWDR